MKITKIEKKKRLYLVQTEGQENIYVTEDTIVRFLLSKGKEITEQEFQDIREFAQLSYGKNLALYYLSFKQRTSKEVAAYLAKYQIEDQAIPNIIQSLTEDGWINDRYYTEQTLYQNSLSGDKGPKALRYKLAQKGISSAILDDELEKVDFFPIALRVAEKSQRKYQNKLPQRALKDKVLQQILTKGFSYDLAKESLASLEWESDLEQEKDLLEKECDKQYRKFSRKYQGYELTQRLIQALLRKGYDYSAIKAALRDL